jgi:hypothetical protein
LIGMKTATEFALPRAQEMSKMLKLSLAIQAAPARERSSRLLDGLLKLVDASAGVMWTCNDSPPRCRPVAFVAPGGRSTTGDPAPDDDSAVTAIIQRPPATRDGPVVRLRRELVDSRVWRIEGNIARLAQREKLRDAVYSQLIRRDDRRSIIALYRIDPTPFSTDHANLLRMMHAMSHDG